MKVFIWEDVLGGYPTGMAVAYAETLEEALYALEEALYAFPDHIANELQREPLTTVIDCETDREPCGVFVELGD